MVFTKIFFYIILIMKKIALTLLLSSTLFGFSFNESLDYLVQKRRELSQKFVKAIYDFDKYISGNYFGSSAMDDNYINLIFSMKFKDSKVTLKPSVKGKIDLPKTRNKLKLILTDHDEKITHQDIKQDYGDKSKNYGTLFGLQYFVKNRFFTKTSLTAGVKFGTPIDFYARAKLTKEIDLNKDWTFNGEQNFYLFSHRGFQSFTTLNFDKKINDDFMFRVSNNIIYKKREDSFEIAHSLMLFQHLTKRDDLIYSATVAGITKDFQHHMPRVSTYELKTLYRHTLKNRWLNFDVIPALYWDRDHSFKPNVSLNLNVSIIFGKYDMH